MTEQEQNERYKTDPIFRNLVDMFRAFLNRRDELELKALGFTPALEGTPQND